MHEYNNEREVFDNLVSNEFANFKQAEISDLESLEALALNLASSGETSLFSTFSYITESGIVTFSTDVYENGCTTQVSINNRQDDVAEFTFGHDNTLQFMGLVPETEDIASRILEETMSDDIFDSYEVNALDMLKSIICANKVSPELVERLVAQSQKNVAEATMLAVQRIADTQQMQNRYSISQDEFTSLHIGYCKTLNNKNSKEEVKNSALVVCYTDTLLGNEYTYYNDEKGHRSLTIDKVNPNDQDAYYETYEDLSLESVEFILSKLNDVVWKDL